MKVELIEDCTGPNPEFSQREAEQCRAEGRRYDVPHTRVMPQGTTIEHPQAHLLCRTSVGNRPPKAIPRDDEAKAAYRRWLATVHRGIRQLQAQLRRPPKEPKMKLALWEMARSYGLDPDHPDDLSGVNIDLGPVGGRIQGMDAIVQFPDSREGAAEAPPARSAPETPGPPAGN